MLRLVRPLVAAACLLAVAGCRDPAPAPGTPPAPTEPEAAPSVEEPAPQLDADSPCGRARACCEAYAQAFSGASVASACVGPAEAAAEPDAAARCARMREGWRAALQAHPEAAPPPTCAEPVRGDSAAGASQPPSSR